MGTVVRGRPHPLSSIPSESYPQRGGTAPSGGVTRDGDEPSTRTPLPAGPTRGHTVGAMGAVAQHHAPFPARLLLPSQQLQAPSLWKRIYQNYKNNHQYKKTKKSRSWGNALQLTCPHPPPCRPSDAQHREGAGRSPGLPSPPGCGGGQKGSSHSSSLPLGLPRRCPRAALPPQEAPSAVRFCDFLWLLAFGTDLPRPRDEAALRWCGGPAGRPHPHQHTSCFLQMLLRAAHVELRQR